MRRARGSNPARHASREWLQSSSPRLLSPARVLEPRACVSPKVAWALEGLAKVHQKLGDFRAAQQAWEAAIAIRNQLQESSTGKELFSAELEKAQQSMEALSQRRTQARRLLQNPLKKRLLLANASRQLAVQGGAADEPSVSDALATPLLAAPAASGAEMAAGGAGGSSQ